MRRISIRKAIKGIFSKMKFRVPFSFHSEGTSKQRNKGIKIILVIKHKRTNKSQAKKNKIVKKLIDYLI